MRFDQMDLISVIVPIYKVEKYLNQCVESIANQSYKNLEIILVDDGSPDKCPQICDEWSKKDSRIKVIHKKNGGAADARNAGLDLACGKYIGFVDGDDWIKPSMYEKLYGACIKYMVPVSCCGRYLSDRNGMKKERFAAENGVCLPAKDALVEILARKAMDVAVWDKLYLKSLFDNIRFPRGEINEDAAIIFKLIESAGRIAHTGTCEYYYRDRPGSTTKLKYRKIERRVIFKNLDELEHFIDSSYPECRTVFKRYKAMNIYYLLNKYIKCNGTVPFPEYRLLMREFRKYKKYFWNDDMVEVKEKIIARMILLGVYAPYLEIKKLLGK